MGTAPGRHARKTSHTAPISLTLSLTAAAAGIVMHMSDSGDVPAQSAPAPTPAASVVENVQQQGTLIAVSPTALTAQGADGVARTYLIDDQTNGITAAGSQMGGTAEAFAVNDPVTIIGVTRGTTHIAATVVHNEVANLNGPPMDHALP